MFLGMLLLITLTFIDSVVGECPITILVNHVELSTVKNNTTTIYYYGEEDHVDVSCVSHATGKSRVQLKYVHSEPFLETFETPVTRPQFPGAGFRIRLQAVHNNSLMTCHCISNVDNGTVRVKFVLMDKLEDMFNLNISGSPVRVLIPEPYDNLGIKLIYHYWTNEKLDIACDTGDEMTKYKWKKCYDPRATCKLTDHRPTRSALTFCASDNTTNTERKVMMLFQPVSDWLNDNTPLFMELEPNNILLETYTYKTEQLLHYVYEDGDNLMLKCYTSPGVNKDTNNCYFLDFNGTEEQHNDSIIMNLQLSSTDDNTEVECSLRSCRKIKGGPTTNPKSRLIRVLFRRKSTDIGSWSILVVGGVLCVVLLSISIAVYKKKRNHIQSSGATDPRCHNHISIRYNPPRWGSHYTGPVGQGDDSTIYSEPWRPIATISTLQGQVTTPELNYATLDIAPSVKNRRNVSSEESPYAEVFFDVSARVRPDDAR